MTKTIVIFVTASSTEEARKIGQTLVEEGKVACC
ncbi:MAG: divalent cation tolerance protein CutA, partial [Planctomycetes bacterium]|nr:divalent cation tolerance protein CutA [Planctomycetota bacterium]